ncbi:MAG: hypothetical protein GYB66_04740 [Chloroflexi bacterium]|nr:hypothetical protein [Chloroflexota bacterium]
MLTREFFDLLIYAVIAFGLVISVIRIYRDLTRPLPAELEDDDFIDLEGEEREDVRY